MKTIFTVWQSR